VVADGESLVRLINVAFRVESIAFDGDRIDAGGVDELMEKGTFLVADDGKTAVGCVYVEPQGERSYLGLLAIGPQRQGTGLGRALVAAAENYSREVHIHTMFLRVISPRAEELVPFYRHLGYAQTGTAPFVSHKTPKVPCHYINMEKRLA
jgi:GNAT superfamily N-acetyltransferase